MAFAKGTKPKRSGLDDGLVKSKKAQKKASQAQKATDTTAEQATKPTPPQPAIETLKIQPNESLADFRARVDAALPLSGITRTSKKLAGVPDHRVTKHERKLKRLQKGWREEEARIREKELEERELAEEEEDEQAALWGETNSPPPPSGKKGKGKKKRKLVAGEVDNNSEDEFEALKRKREERKGLHDVVSAPPTFTKVPREIFKVRDGAGARVGDVRRDVGSLKRREELGEERRGVVERYREVMAKKRGQ